MMNASISHMLPLVALKSDGHVLVLTDDDADCDEITRTDIRVPSDDKDDSDWFEPTAVAQGESKSDKYASEDNWCDGLTLFAIFLAFIGFAGMCASDMADKAGTKLQRVRLDQNCALTYK